jgi:transposase
MHLAPVTAHPARAGSASRIVVAGIDTHKDLHVAAVIDLGETVLGRHSFSTTRAGYRALIRWVRGFGDVRTVGVEGTGSYGVGVTRHLTDGGIEVLEVDRPDRSEHRRRGKDDDVDAIKRRPGRPTRTAHQHPQDRGRRRVGLRVLRVTRTSAVRARRTALQLLRMQFVSAPQELRDQVRNLTRMQLIGTLAGPSEPDRPQR